MIDDIIKIGGLIGRIFGNAGKGSADQRTSENNQRLAQAQIQNSDALNRGQLQTSHDLSAANLDLNQRQFQQNEPAAQARQAAMGSLLQRIQPLQMQGLSPRVQQSMPHMNSIIDALGPEARQAGGLLAQRGVSGLQNPTQFKALPALNLPPSVNPQMQGSGILEKILGAGGLIGSTVGALGDLNSLGGQPQPQAPYAAQPRPFNPYEVEPD